jgi:Na+/H+-dicarboxylate symporter
LTPKLFPRLDLHWKIILGIFLGLIVSVAAHQIPSGVYFTQTYIKPFGTIFIRLLQLMAIPLLLTSLISGVAGMRTENSLAPLSLRTLLLFAFTCITSTTIGIALASWIQPGAVVSSDIAVELTKTYAMDVSKAIEMKQNVGDSFLSLVVQWVPSNIFYAFTQNSMMLSVVLFSILFGAAAAQLPPTTIQPTLQLLESIQQILLQVVNYIMAVAPFGVFALMASIQLDWNILLSLLLYMLTVAIGLSIILFLLYPSIVYGLGRMPYRFFFKTMQPAFLTAFSTSSSVATLPVTMRCVVDGFKIPKAAAHFILSLGTTVNMDGTALYQAVATLFIAQVMGIELGMAELITIIFTCTLASVGAAGVPGAGMITMIIVLQSVGIPVEALAFILAPDRLLDMYRSVINVAGDATAAVALGEKETG